MGLFSPWFLAGVALLGLPIWLHLLEKHKSTLKPFASLMFFERRTQSSIKHRRLRYLLLFALRCLVLLLLALAFANPYFKTRNAAAASGDRLMVLAIDQSFSMRQGDRLARAKQEASSALSGMGGGRAQVLAFAAGVRSLGDPTTDTSALRAAINGIQPTDERSSYAELVRAVRSLAQSSRAPIELHLFSDTQKTSMPPSFADLRLPEGAKLVVHPVASKREPNFTVENVNAPRRVFDPKRVRMQVTVAGFGNEQKAARRVSLLMNGKEVQSKTVDVSAGGRTSTEFTGFDVPYGANRVEVRIDGGDPFPADDRFIAAMERTDPRPALFVHDGRGGRDVLYFRTALDTATEAAFQIEPVAASAVGNISPSKYAFVVLSDVGSVPSSFEDALRNYVRSGGSLLLALGRYSALAKQILVFDESVVEARYSSRDGERFQTVAWLDPAHPAMSRAGKLDNVKFYQAVRVNPGKAKIAARLSDETPLLLEKQVGQGRVLVFASTFDNIANDFPLHASFVPFVEQTSAYLGKIEKTQNNWAVGSFLDLRAGESRGASIEVIGPKGERAVALDESTKLQSLRLAAEGFYDVRRPSGRHELVAVNPDRQESDLDVISAETLTLWRNTGSGAAAGADGAEAEEKTVSIWWYVLLALLALALAESLLGNRYLSAEKEAA